MEIPKNGELQVRLRNLLDTTGKLEGVLVYVHQNDLSRTIGEAVARECDLPEEVLARALREAVQWLEASSMAGRVNLRGLPEYCVGRN